MMKKLLTYCSLLGIALSGYQPAFAREYLNFGNITVGIPTTDAQDGNISVENQKITLSVMPVVTQEKNKIIYQWNLSNTMGPKIDESKGQFCNNEQRNGVYYWEIKFYPGVNIIDQPYLARYFNINLTANAEKINGNMQDQRLRVQNGQSVNFRLELELKKEALYNGNADYIIRKEQPLSVVSIFCENGSSLSGDKWTGKRSLYNKFTGVELLAADDATLHLSRTCIIAGNRDFEVNLSPVTKAELENRERIKGGQFDLLLSCSEAEIKNAYIMFTDQLDPGNKTTFLTTQNGSTKREDVKFILQDSEGKAVQYGPAPTSSIVLQGEQVNYPNMQLFGKRLSNEPFLKKSYTVYYHRTGQTQTVEPGEVQGKVIYNFYYN
ncbi:fimbrial protein [Gallibacterium anatis]|uniref:fimbrial protein n=1 Tax=Gallibacterium anatis TaxID=750 RepID=UPI0018AFB347|nr:fimbrial protein [Gallibacterium anatis]